MRLLLLTTLTMIAFAANSVLNRTALEGGGIDPLSFAFIRVAAGVAVLLILVFARREAALIKGAFDPGATVGLLAYILGFSFAYNSLYTGLGALILFGGVQITMFFGAVLFGRKPLALQWVGAGVAFSGLAILLAPSGAAPSISGIALMGIAAVGWGIYSLQGAKAKHPLIATCTNFSAALPVMIGAWLMMETAPIEAKGAALAIVSGGITSALGYALWYQVLPQLQTATAAVAQLTVPLIAAFGGFVVLGEPVTVAFAVSSALVLGGIAISVWAANRG
ncbi:MAG: DMT family transporter [Amylibacter sp.]